MTPSKLLLAKLRKYLKLALHTNRLSSLLPTYIYYSTPLSKMLSVECDPFKNIRQISPIGHWYLDIRKVKKFLLKAHKKAQ